MTFMKATLRVLFDSKLAHLMFLKFSRIKRVKREGSFDLGISKLYSKVRPPGKFTIPPQFLNEEEIKKTVETLKQEGVKILEKKISPEDIHELMNFAYQKPAFVDGKEGKITISPEKIPTEHFRYNWHMSDLLRLPSIQKMISDTTFHSIAQGYLGCTPFLTDVSMWLSTTYKEKTADHIFHCDNDSPKFLKFFIYLTDVNETSGAHVYVKKTNHPKNRRKFTVSQRYSDEEIANHFGKENVVAMCGSAGTIIAEDTSGFHRGTLPVDKPRFILQLRYSIIDTFQRETRSRTEKRTFKVEDQQTKKILRILEENS